MAQFEHAGGRHTGGCWGSVVCLAAVAPRLTSIQTGTVPLDAQEVWQGFWGEATANVWNTIVWDARMPRLRSWP